MYCEESVSLLFVLLAALLGACLQYFWLRRRFARSLNLLNEAVNEIASGNMEKHMPDASDAVTGKLAANINLIVENLKERIKERDAARETLINTYREMEENSRVLEKEIFAHMEAERSLSESKDKFATAFRCSADVIGIVRATDMRNLELSDAFFAKFGYEKAEVFGRSSAEFGLWLRPRERAEYWRQLFEKKMVRDVETHWRTKQGEILIGTMAGDVIELGGERCVLFTWHDITARKKAEDDLREANEQLERKVDERTQELQAKNEELAQLLEELQRTQEFLLQSEKMAAMTNLVVGVAHEINTPVGVAITLASHLEENAKRFQTLLRAGGAKRSDLDEYLSEGREAAEMMLKNLQRVASLIGTFKQVSVDQATETKRHFNLRLQLEEIAQSVAPALQKAGHRLELDCDHELELDGYPNAFSQIIMNLFNNSLVHAYEAGQKGKITLSVRRSAEGINVVYQDDGKGVSEEVLGKIFNPFFTTRRGQGGMGLGLCIVYNLVTQQFGGTIECSSRPGEGMRLSITFA